MKKLVAVLFLVIPALAFAQVKPSLVKSDKLFREGKLDEAKTLIDVTTASQDFMVDKKGQPSKDAAKAWYLKGMIYMGIDTTKKAQFKSLDSNPFVTAKLAFDKAKELDPKSTSFTKDAAGFPMLNFQLEQVYANVYFNRAINAFNDKTEDKDKKEANNQTAFESISRTLYFTPKDTAALLYGGGLFAPAVKAYDKGIEWLQGYIAEGGKDPQGYALLANIHTAYKKDNVTGLKVLQEAHAKFPNYKDFTSMELNIYLTEKKYDLAKTMVENEMAADPTNTNNIFLLGQLNREMGNREEAKTAFKKVLELDPKNFDAAMETAGLYWADAKEIKDQMGKLGTSKADMEKLKSLDAKYVEKLKAYIPYIEACEKISPDDINVLYSELNVYGDLDDQPKVARVKKRLKALGEDVN